MLRSFAAGVTLALSLASLAPSAQAQVRERDVTITGPRGNSIKRQFESVRTPGGLTREMTITRPAGTYHRELNVTRPPSVVGGGPRGWGYPPVRNDVYIERDVIVPPPRPFVPGFSSFNLSLGLPLLPPPPPPPAVIYQPAPVVVAQPGVVNVPAPSYAVSTSVGVDPVAEAIGRLSSHGRPDRGRHRDRPDRRAEHRDYPRTGHHLRQKAGSARRRRAGALEDAQGR